MSNNAGRPRETKVRARDYWAWKDYTLGFNQSTILMRYTKPIRIDRFGRWVRIKLIELPAKPKAARRSGK